MDPRRAPHHRRRDLPGPLLLTPPRWSSSNSSNPPDAGPIRRITRVTRVLPGARASGARQDAPMADTSEPLETPAPKPRRTRTAKAAESGAPAPARRRTAKATEAPALVDRGDAWCVVGAGPHGLSALKALLQNGIDADGFERESDVGGNWNFGAENSPRLRVDAPHLVQAVHAVPRLPDARLLPRLPEPPSGEGVLRAVRRPLRAAAAHHASAPTSCARCRSTAARAGTSPSRP